MSTKRRFRQRLQHHARKQEYKYINAKIIMYRVANMSMYNRR